MQVCVVRIPDGLPKWHLVTGYMKLRREVFMEKMAWQLHQIDGMEYEQYDTFGAVYVIAHDGDDVLGGARLLPSTHLSGGGRLAYSYMIRDACKNRLEGLPANLCDTEPPVDSAIWELTRLATKPGTRIATEILTTANRFLRSEGARACLFLGPPAFMRMAKGLGFLPKPLGPTTGNADGRFLAFQCAVL